LLYSDNAINKNNLQSHLIFDKIRGRWETLDLGASPISNVSHFCFEPRACLRARPRRQPSQVPSARVERKTQETNNSGGGSKRAKPWAAVDRSVNLKIQGGQV
jgi:hypothetical protein